MRCLFALAVILATSSVTAETYRWVDPATGKTMYTDTPPPGSAKQISKTKKPESEETQQSYAIKQAAEYFPVTLYTTPDCVEDCKKARDLLNGRGVPFAEKMLQKPDEAAELKQLVGDLFVPTLKVGRQPVRGFQSEGYNNLLDLAGYPKTAPYGSKPSGGLTK